MRKIPFYLLLIIFVNKGIKTNAQDSLLTRLAVESLFYINKPGSEYAGAGWDSLITAASKTSNVLIGEDHFTNEIPLFVAALTRKIKFDNFFCELDPLTTNYLAGNIQRLPQSELNNYLEKYKNTFSFYSKAPEFNLFRDLVKSGISIFGTEQVSLFSDRLLFDELYKISKNNAARILYKEMSQNSKEYVENFPAATNKTFYILDDEYGKKLEELDKLAITSKEKSVLDDIRISKKIYDKQDHQLRISLMKKQMLTHLNKLSTQKNLFKYGANHMCRGESFLRIFDLGNLISNISDARFERSLHIMIVGKSGQQASGIPGMPAEKLDTENGDLKFLKLFYSVVRGKDYHVFQLGAIRKAYEKGALQITDSWLLRTIKGYDYLVIIPEVTPASEL